MPELIDRQAAIQSIKNDYCSKCVCDLCSACEYRFCIDILENAPTIEAEPVRHGRWIEKPPYSDETVKGLEFQIVCSRCDEQNSSITFDENSVPIAKTFYRTRYCPNCGADMREGGEQE